MANGQIQVEIVDTQKALEGINRIEKALSEITGANQVQAILEYANGLKNEPGSMPGIHYQSELLPKHLRLIIGRNLYSEMLCEIGRAHV